MVPMGMALRLMMRTLKNARRALNFTSTVGGDLGERRVAQRFPVFADTEEVTGSNPVAPTNSPLTSANASAWCLRSAANPYEST
jgi:hypothetical protein